jgi:hypothetical protein
MNEASYRKMIAKVHTWQTITIKQRKKIIREFILDEAWVGNQVDQGAYRKAVVKQDQVLFKKLKKSAEARRKKALQWLTANGY